MTRYSILALVLMAAHPATAQTSLLYTISFPGYMHHESEVALHIHNAPAGPLIFRMSRSSPGRYATAEFGKNVYFVKADGSRDNQSKSEQLEVQRVDGDVYEIRGEHGSEVTIRYTLFGDRTDGTYVGIDRTHAHLNMPGTIMWVEGLDKAPIKVVFRIPEGLHWQVATQLVPTNDPNTFTAPGLQYLMDCPTELSDFRIASFTDTNPDGKVLTFRVTLHADTDDDTWNTLVADIKKLVAEEKKVFGVYAPYDYGTYTFILDANGWDNWDGMEHRNSTCITLQMDKIGAAQIPTVLDVVAHEFFHSWNVKRIRPSSLEPFNFTKSDMSKELWVAEGFTQYYGNLILTRAGFKTQEEEIQLLGNYMNGFLHSPGVKYFTPIESSEQAVFTDAGVSVDKSNFANTFFSYYTYGANIAFILDMHLQKDFHKDLDHYMRTLWYDYGKTAHWYDVHDLETALAEITTPSYAKAFFDEYVYSSRHDDCTPYFAVEGLILTNKSAGKAGWGEVSYRTDADGHVTLDRGTVMGTPIYEAGLEVGDAILSIDSQPIHSAADIATILSTSAPGKMVSVEYSNRGVHGTVQVTLGEAGQYAFDADNTNRHAWLGAQDIPPVVPPSAPKPPL